MIKPPNSDPARRKQWDTLLAVDDALKEMYSTLDRLQILRDTVIVFMTDNGFAFGEHRWLGKHCAYEECIHTPLLVWYPGAAGRPIHELVSDVDIAPTLAGLAGITPASPVDGHSFVPLLLGQSSAWPDEVLIRGYNTNEAGTPPTFWGVRTPQYKYIETVPTGEVELYDLASDPFELSNVADQPDYAEREPS